MNDTLSQQNTSNLLAVEENLIVWNDVLKKLQLSLGTDV